MTDAPPSRVLTLRAWLKYAAKHGALVAHGSLDIPASASLDSRTVQAAQHLLDTLSSDVLAQTVSAFGALSVKGGKAEREYAAICESSGEWWKWHQDL